MRALLVLNGSNLNLLGRREPEVYIALRDAVASIRLRHAFIAPVARSQVAGFGADSSLQGIDALLGR